MKTTARTQGAALAACLVLVALGAAACSTSPPSTPAPTAAGALVTVETRGGLCADGPCGTTIIVERDGQVHLAAKPPNDLGVVPPAALAALDAAIRSADFAELARHPFSGTCPTAFDGQEIVFEFGAPGGIRRIATCEVDVDLASPLFVAVAAAVAPFVVLPAR